jgi:hypothetical protein
MPRFEEKAALARLIPAKSGSNRKHYPTSYSYIETIKNVRIKTIFIKND